MAETKIARAKELVGRAKRRVASMLPEDEHDYTADWVYEEAIAVGLTAAFSSGVSDEAREEINAFSGRLARRGAAVEAARLSLMERVREFVNEHCRNGSKTARADYSKMITLDKLEALRAAFDELERVRPRGEPPALVSEKENRDARR